MKIEKINYQKLYPTGNWLNERFGFDISIDEGDNIKETFKTLRKMADDIHKELNPPQESNDESIHSSQIENQWVRHEEPLPKPPQEIQIGNIEAGIRSCKDIKILETYRFIVKKDAGLQKAYDEMMEKLKQQ
jgi:hypothetical protein